MHLSPLRFVRSDATDKSRSDTSLDQLTSCARNAGAAEILLSPLKAELRNQSTLSEQKEFVIERMPGNFDA